MNRNQINAFLLKFLMKTGRKRTLDVLKNQLQEERKEEPSKSAGVKLSFAIQRPPKRKPLLEVPAIQKRTKKAKIASDDAQLTEKKEEFKKLAKAVGLPKSHLDFFYKHRDSFHWEMKKDNNIYCTGKRGNCKFKTKVKKNCLFEHMISVHNHGEFKCKEENCDYVGYSQTNLKMHVAQFHGIGKFGSNRNRGFPCSFSSCDYAATSAADLQKHQAVHKNILLRCEFCTYSSTNMKNLDFHMLVHFRILNFQCDLCPSKFSRKLDLNRHKEIHTQESRDCNYCHAGFPKRHLLQKHLLTCETRLRFYKEYH